ncbi:MAG: hypothetical protein KF687_16320 [Cyclobacteriaceae bacterium]|nr:hypothetical protein [Cyclobacteriaceae bacterium]
MGRNEIRLRRNMMSSGRIARHRNYTELMRQHDRDTRLKRILRVFTYFLIVLFLLIILLIVVRWESKQTEKSDNKSSVESFHVTQRDFISGL